MYIYNRIMSRTRSVRRLIVGGLLITSVCANVTGCKGEIALPSLQHVNAETIDSIGTESFYNNQENSNFGEVSTTIETTTIEPLSTEELTLDGHNIQKAAMLYNVYGIDIRYDGQVVWNYKGIQTGTTDAAIIAGRLDALEECLKEYPIELFTDLSTHSPIIINLVEDLGGPDGLTDATDPSKIQIALSSNNSLSYFKVAVHHELFHFIEYTILNTDEDAAAFLMATDAYNDPAMYGSDGNFGTIYDVDADIYHQYFTSVYGKTSASEDRAEVFSYYMGKTTKDCMKVNDSPITQKMLLISTAIRQFCPSLNVYESGLLPWEQKLTY